MGMFEVLEIIGILLLIAGFVLVGIEMAIPGFGAPGLSGTVCLILGIVCSADTFEQGLTITIIVVVVLAVMLTIIMLMLRKVTSPIVLEESLKPEKDHLSSRDLDYLVSREGVASTDLRPSGKCKIDGVEFDVRTDGPYIVKDTGVIIRDIRNNTIIVTAKTDVRTNIKENLTGN